MKRLIAFTLAALTAVSFTTGCGKKEKKGGSWADGISGQIADQQAKSLSPDEYLDYLVVDNGDISGAINNVFSSVRSSTGSGAGSSKLTLSAGDGMYNFLGAIDSSVAQTYKNNMGWFKDLSFAIDSNVQNSDLIKLVAGLGLNGTNIATLDFTASLKQGKYYLAIPELSSTTLLMETDGVVSPDVFTSSLSIYPDGETAERMYKKYAKIALDNINIDTKTPTTLNAGGVSAKADLISVVLDEKLATEIGADMLEAAVSDPDIRNIITNFTSNNVFFATYYALSEESPEETSPYLYAVDDVVYLDNKEFRITEVSEREVQLLDPTLVYPIFRAENKETFHHLLEQDDRNAKYFPDMPFTAITEPNLQEVAASEAVNESETSKLSERYSILIDGEHFSIWDEVENDFYLDEAGLAHHFRDMGMAESFLEELYRHIAEQEEAIEKTQYETETVAVYPAEQNKLPFDVVIQTLRTSEPEKPAPIQKHNFRISNDELGYGGPKSKFRMNMDAINTLQQLEFEKRLATPEEQETLSKYVGWGSLPQAFDENNPAWANEFQELYAALSPEE
ncbi:MAG: hypothetical protein E7583_09045, partial [Ruminococcaceae bacterium]|nr:hypothetical protein [Oscillospiraceae bacterium]